MCFTCFSFHVGCVLILWKLILCLCCKDIRHCFEISPMYVMLVRNPSFWKVPLILNSHSIALTVPCLLKSLWMVQTSILGAVRWRLIGERWVISYPELYYLFTYLLISYYRQIIQYYIIHDWWLNTDCVSFIVHVSWQTLLSRLGFILYMWLVMA